QPEIARQRIVASEAFKAPVRRTLLRGRPMLRERSKDRSLCSCPAEAPKAAGVQGQAEYPARAKPAAEANFRRPTQAGALRYSVRPAWPIHFRQFYLPAFRVFSLRSLKPVWAAAAQHRRI